MDENIQEIYLDGRYCLKEREFVASLAPGVVKGRGVFETMRISGGAPLFFDEHYQRLRWGLGVLGISGAHSKNKYLRIVERLNWTTTFRERVVRIAVWQDSVKKHASVILREAPEITAREFSKGYKACFSVLTRNRTATSHIKSIRYGLFLNAAKEAKKAKCQEAFLFNLRGHLVEGARTNVFIAGKGKILTPAIQCGGLNGITRQKVMGLARVSGICCQAGFLTKRDVLEAEEVFVTNSAIGIMPVTEVQGKKIDSGRPGKLTQRLKDAYLQCVKNNSRRADR